jgi:hypothetical protein
MSGNNMQKSFWTLLTIFSLFLGSVKPAFALSLPSFPSCANPQGTTKVSYSEGTHGIVGSGLTYTGKDTVYTLTDDTLTQCFCGKDGEGIQTNWWKASSLTQDEINILKTSGWVYIPAGNLWGLAEAPYVAQNISYSCLPGSTLGTSDSQDNGIGGGEVLGLAATGNSILVYLSFLASVILLYLGIRRIRTNS